MCKQVCEQTEEGRKLWEQWRQHHNNWKAVSAFHRERVLEAIAAELRKGPALMFLDYKDGTAEVLKVQPNLTEPEE